MRADEIRQLARETAQRLAAASVRPETVPHLVPTSVSERYGILRLRQREMIKEEVRHIAFGWELWRQTTGSHVRKAEPVPLVRSTIESIWLATDGVLARVDLEETRGPIERDLATHHVAADWELERSDYDWQIQGLALADGSFYERIEFVPLGIPSGRTPLARLHARLVALQARA